MPSFHTITAATALLLGLVANAQEPVPALPPMNQHVLDFVNDRMGKRVGSGQCWDMPAAALEAAQAEWDGGYGFGRVIDPKKEPVLPGDIVQFEGVEVRYSTANSEHRESMTHHTAVIHAVHADGSYSLAHQNFGPAGKKVGVTEWSPRHVVKGKYTFYRPVPKA